jgi:hypothetical protein
LLLLLLLMMMMILFVLLTLASSMTSISSTSSAFFFFAFFSNFQYICEGKGKKGAGRKEDKKKFNNGNTERSAPFIFLFIKSREKTKY